MTPKVSILILNYNGKKHTLACLQSLAKISYKDKEIILYDNGSHDDTASAVRKQFKNVHVVHRKDNIGYSGGTNDAYRYAGGKYILFLNNDTIVSADFLTKLVKRMEVDPANGIVQPKLVFLRTKKLQAGSAFFTPTGFLYYIGYGKDPKTSAYNTAADMYTVNGACMLVKREVIQKVGLFDKDFFLYFEETDFCHRALLAGYKIWYEPKARVRHIGSADNSGYKHSLLVYYSTRNRFMSYFKNLGAITFCFVMPVHVLFNIFSIGAYILSGRPDNALAVIKAFAYNLWHLGEIWKKRIYVQKKIRRLADSDFLPAVTRYPRPEYYIRLVTGLEQYKD